MKRWWSGPANLAEPPSPRAATVAITIPSAFPCGWPAAASKAARVHGQPMTGAIKPSTNKCNIHDLHATMLCLMGMDHTKLTYRFSGRDMRLTDVYGEVLSPSSHN